MLDWAYYICLCVKLMFLFSLKVKYLKKRDNLKLNKTLKINLNLKNGNFFFRILIFFKLKQKKIKHLSR
jgi:hypothetical protein